MPSKFKKPPIQRDYLTRSELLTVVPLSMTSITVLEDKGIFPKRFRLEPLRRVAWPRREVEKFLALRARRRPGQSYVGAARDDQANTP
jgi:predicted DNA-binding transcriptional regulator AlpA